MDTHTVTILWIMFASAFGFGLGLATFKRAYSHDVNALKQEVNILSAQLFNVKLALDDKSKAFTVLCTERDMQNIVIRQRGDELQDALKLPANLQAEIDTAADTNKQATAIIKNLREDNVALKHEWDSVVGLWATDRPSLIGDRFKSAFYRIGYKGERL